VFFAGLAYLFVKRRITWPEDSWLALAAYAGIAAAVLTQLGWLPKQLAYGAYFAFGGSLFFFLHGYRKALLVLVPAFAQILWHFPTYSAEDFTVIAVNRPGQFLLLAIIVTAMIVLAKVHIRHRLLDKRLGELSYPLYLNHYVIAVIILNCTGQPSIGFMLAGLLASLALSFIMFMLVEKPLLRLRRYIRERGGMAEAT
jgi:peptidoglycan/LPS O-acetylase OafA/YrhL